jgi:3-methyladenine DNA glycosylase AlkD
MSSAEIVQAVRAWLARVGDPAARKALETLIPGARTVGVKVPLLRAAAVELRRSHKDLPLEAAAEAMDLFAASKVREEILIGTFWLARYGKKLVPLPWSRIAGWLPVLDNWETCDQLAMGVAAPVLAADPDPAARLVPLTTARSPWSRRFALATVSALNQKGRAQVAVTLKVCAPLVADPAPEVRKAVGWALRAATPHDPEAVERFLKAHLRTAHPTVLREGSEKLPVDRQLALTKAAGSPKTRAKEPPPAKPAKTRPASSRRRS